MIGLAGCGSPTGAPPADRHRVDDHPERAALPPEQADQPADPAEPALRPADPAEPALRPARCPAGAENCAAATGRVIYVESVDPDGDGDLHIVLAGGSVTAPGITVLDVGRDLRPAGDPRIGDEVTGAGPVFTGSYGQRQIEVTVLRVAPR